MAQKQLPVYLFTGFLSGGKTHMIQESMEDQRFNTGEKTLILLCEQGEDELDPTRFYGQNVYLELIEEESELTRERLKQIESRHKYDRVIIEYNGMWQLSTLFEAMPTHWAIYQEMMFAEAETFISYNNNMRQLMVDKLTGAEMVILTRTPNDIDKDAIHKIIRGISRRAAITYDYPDGHVEYDEIEDPLPFDLSAPVVEIDDRDYAIWYRDMAEELDKYEGKTVKLTGLVARDKSLGKDSLVLGRHVMTCCADDIAFHGLVCKFPENVDFKTRDWLTVTATFKIENHKLYNRLGPVLYVTAWQEEQRPDPEIATFY
ncbi:MAG: TIGR03943 family protein [Clostridia bacterium]|nr:TIGR03943 family protein [Clostridia bacterium]